MGPGTRKWYQTDREGISYHYHSKLGEVLDGDPLKKVVDGFGMMAEVGEVLGTLTYNVDQAEYYSCSIFLRPTSCALSYNSLY